MTVFYVVWLEEDYNGFDSVQKRKKFYNRADAERYADELFDCDYPVKVETGKEF